MKYVDDGNAEDGLARIRGREWADRQAIYAAFAWMEGLRLATKPDGDPVIHPPAVDDWLISPWRSPRGPLCVLLALLFAVPVAAQPTPTPAPFIADPREHARAEGVEVVVHDCEQRRSPNTISASGRLTVGGKLETWCGFECAGGHLWIGVLP